MKKKIILTFLSLFWFIFSIIFFTNITFWNSRNTWYKIPINWSENVIPYNTSSQCRTLTNNSSSNKWIASKTSTSWTTFLARNNSNYDLDVSSCSVSWPCTNIPHWARLYWNSTSYNLVEAPTWTTLNSATAWYNTSPTVNTCQFSCPSWTEYRNSKCLTPPPSTTYWWTSCGSPIYLWDDTYGFWQSCFNKNFKSWYESIPSCPTGRTRVTSLSWNSQRDILFDRYNNWTTKSTYIFKQNTSRSANQYDWNWTTRATITCDYLNLAIFDWIDEYRNLSSSPHTVTRGYLRNSSTTNPTIWTIHDTYSNINRQIKSISVYTRNWRSVWNWNTNVSTRACKWTTTYISGNYNRWTLWVKTLCTKDWT